MSYKNLSMVPKVIFGRSSFDQLGDLLEPHRLNSTAPFIFLVDAVLKAESHITSRIPIGYEDKIHYVSVDTALQATAVDELVETLILTSKEKPSGIIGIGGGTLLDFTKAVAIMLTNEGHAEDYRGWGQVKHKGIYHVGIPTLSGTGAEVSNTLTLKGERFKFEMQSDQIHFDQVLLDSELTRTAPKDQWFYTGMLCFIRAVEALQSNLLNAFSMSYVTMAYNSVLDVFLKGTPPKKEEQDRLMMASWQGGIGQVSHKVGMAQALSNGLVTVLGLDYNISVCIAFNALETFYSEGVQLFRTMLNQQGIDLPKAICLDISAKDVELMVAAALRLEYLWENTLGAHWKKIITPMTLKDLYLNM